MVQSSIVVLRRMVQLLEDHGIMHCESFFHLNEDVACDVQLLTEICTLEDTLKSRQVQFRRKLTHTGNDVITYMKDFMCNFE